MRRRTFLKMAAASGASALTVRGVAALAAGWPIPALRRAAPPQTIEIVAGEPLGIIPPEIDGHFVEHLGGVVACTAIVMTGAKPARVRATTLAAGTIQDVNTFDAPDRIRPTEAAVAVPADGRIVHVFPAASVTRLLVELE